MRKSEILRARTLFRRVAVTGTRLDGQLLRCTYYVHREGDTQLQVAFKVPSRHFNAVRRNRLRRLMREAMDMERSPLDAALAGNIVNVACVLFFRGRKGLLAERVSLVQVREDVAMFCRVLASHVERERS